MSTKKGIAILGSTGSIGTQALEVIEAYPDYFDLQVITAGKNADLLIQQAKKHQPNTVVIGDESAYKKVKEALWEDDIHVYCGEEALCQVVESTEVQTVLTALVGYAGLKPTIHAIEAGKTIALANKETLVVAGEYITKLAREKGVNIYPVDSEHSAIFQCLVGEFHNPIEKIYLTASGGPFRNRDPETLYQVTPEQACAHPNWVMGRKISVDSATMMNKALEVIEAKYLFGVSPAQIEVVIHPQSIVHSMVEFVDRSILAQLSHSDMCLPIQYAVTCPERVENSLRPLDFASLGSLDFEAPRRSDFPALDLAVEAGTRGGTRPAVLNAANEVAVEAFLSGRIAFPGIWKLVTEVLEKCPHTEHPSLETLLATDTEARRLARATIG
jgi:1-deoxy-D-xylulose-5-phosphate reductoisomerase